MTDESPATQPASDSAPSQPPHQAAHAPGTYAPYRRLIVDPSTRDALLLQVRSTVVGLRSGYRWHVIASIVALAAMFFMKPGGMLGANRFAVYAAILTIDLLAIAGLRTLAESPRRFLMPLIACDLLLTVGLLVLSVVYGEFSLAWVLLLVLPVMLIIYARDAKAIAPILAEHALYRRTLADDSANDA